MNKKVEKLFIGTDVARTASLVIGGTGDNIVAGELVVLDKNKNILSAGATIADSDKIYIVEGLADTYDYVTPNGTAITGVRQLLVSDAIDGSAVTGWEGASYEAAAETVSTLSGALTPVVGEEYVLRIVYPDVVEHPGQFTYTYRVVATSVTLATLYTAFAAQINAHAERRINAVATTTPDVLTLTAKAYDDNATVDSINEYKQVIFDVFLQSDNFGSVVVTKTIDPFPGEGTWQLVRDEEKWSQGYEGLLNRTNFPTQVPTFRTVLSETYDCLVIRHKNWYTSSDNWEKQVDITTKLYIPVGASQATNILAALNPWMASTPRALANVSI